MRRRSPNLKELEVDPKQVNALSLSFRRCFGSKTTTMLPAISPNFVSSPADPAIPELKKQVGGKAK